MLTNTDCLLNGKIFDIHIFPELSSSQLFSIVGKQSPNGYIEDLNNFSWSFQFIETEKLKNATEYNEEPEGGWPACYLRFLKEDETAAKYSPEYLGRDNWIKNTWIKHTDTYPLFVILENGYYRIIDGHHRLAGAFYYNVSKIAIILGLQK